MLDLLDHTYLKRQFFIFNHFRNVMVSALHTDLMFSSAAIRLFSGVEACLSHNLFWNLEFPFRFLYGILKLRTKQVDGNPPCVSEWWLRVRHWWVRKLSALRHLSLGEVFISLVLFRLQSCAQTTEVVYGLMGCCICSCKPFQDLCPLRCPHPCMN